jgi:hypothetical protein
MNYLNAMSTYMLPPPTTNTNNVKKNMHNTKITHTTDKRLEDMSNRTNKITHLWGGKIYEDYIKMC